MLRLYQLLLQTDYSLFYTQGKKFNDDGFMLEGEEVEEEEDDEDVQLDEQGNAVPNKLDMEPVRGLCSILMSPLCLLGCWTKELLNTSSFIFFPFAFVRVQFL